MELNNFERETTINWNAGDDTATVDTRMPVIMRFMDKLGIEPYKVHRDSEGAIYGKCYRIPKKWVRLPLRKSGKKREMTDEQRAAVADRLGKARATRQHLTCGEKSNTDI